jgi:hypothetical protein
MSAGAMERLERAVSSLVEYMRIVDILRAKDRQVRTEWYLGYV